MRKHERGLPWTPMAIVLEHMAGYLTFLVSGKVS